MYMETTTNQTYIAERKARTANVNQSVADPNSSGAASTAALGLLPLLSAVVAVGYSLL